MQEEFTYIHNKKTIIVKYFAYTIATSSCQRCGKHAKCNCAAVAKRGKYNPTYKSLYICRPCFEALRIMPDLEFYDELI